MEEDREVEVWKAIPNYEGLYEVSSWGNVCSLGRWKNARGNSLQYVGVSYDKSKPNYPWVAGFTFNKKNIKVGNYVTEEDAYQAYLNALKEYGLKNKYAKQTN